MSPANRAAALSVHFEAGDLFVLAHAEGFGSYAEARQAIAAGPGLLFEDGWISLVLPDRPPKRLCPSDGDECGRWPAGADRTSQEDQWAAQLPVPAFLALRPDAARFCPVWAVVMEWESGANGRFSRMIASASGSTDTLAPR